MGTLVRAVWGSVCDQEIAPLLRECDAVFGCTDDYLGRVTLNRLAVWYYIPVLDMGVVVDSEGGTIREATGWVTILLPGNACLRCRERIPQDKLESQQLQRLDPKRHAALVREGYVRELGQPDPAVVMFTTAIAARAIMEFMQLITGFMGDDRTATEVLERFHESEVRTNSRPGQEGCYCTSPAQWGRGDEQRFLDLTWRTRPVPKRGGSW
jgi:molybdopterin/thiamine biosynthesis adenylyltransferase